MSDPRRRIEPHFGDGRSGDPDRSGRALSSDRERPWFKPDGNGHGNRYSDDDDDPEIRPMVKWALFAITLACLVFVGDRLLTRYQQARAVQALEAEVENFTRQLAEMGEQAQAEQAARVEALRRQRAQTVEGRWLSKNCQDWTASFRQLKAKTAEQEMRRHCGNYERYLSTGRIPPGTPR